VRSKLRIFVSLPVLLLVLFLAAAVIFLKSDYAAEQARDLLRARLGEQLGAEVSIARCAIELLPPGLEAGDVELGDGRGGRLLQASSIRVELDALSLLVGRLDIDRVALHEPRLVLVLRDGRLANLPAPPATGADGGPAPSLALERIEVERGQLDLLLEGFGMLHLQEVAAVVEEGDEDDAGQPTREVSLEVGGGSLDLEGGRGTSLPVGRCLAKAALDSRGLDLARLSIQVHELHLAAQGRVDWSGQEVRPRLGLAVRGSMALLHLLLPDIPPMRGQVVVSADTDLGPDGLEARGALDAKGYGVMTATQIDATTRFEVSPRGLRLQGLRASCPGGRVAGEAHLDFDEKLGFGGELTLEHAELIPSLGMGGLDFRVIDLRGEGGLEFKGQFVARQGAWVRVQVDLAAERLVVLAGADLTAVDFSGGRLRTEAVFDGRQVRFPAIRLEKGASQLEGQGRIGFLDGAVQAALHADRLSLADLAPIAGQRMAGEGNLQVQVGGAFPRPHIDARLGFQEVSAEERAVGQVSGHLVLDGAEMQLEPLTVTNREGTLRAEGRLGLLAPHPVDGGLELVAVPLEVLVAAARGGRVPEGLRGKVGGQVQARGSLLQPLLDFQVAFADLHAGGLVFEEGGALGRLERGVWRLESFEARMGSGWLFAQGSLGQDSGVDLVGYSTGLKADAFGPLLGAAPPVAFRLDLNASLKGPLRSPAFEGWAKLYDTRLAGVDLPSSFVSARATTERVEIAGRFLGDAAQLEGFAELETDLPFRAELRLESDLAGLFLPRAIDGRARSLKLAGQAQARGLLLRPASVEAELAVEQLALSWGGLSLRNRDALLATLRQGRLQVRHLELVGSGTDLALEGHLEAGSGPRLRLVGDLDAGLASLLFPWAESAVGKARLQLALGGAWAAPQLTGRLDFELERLRLAFLSQDLEATRGHALLRAGNLTVPRVTGRLGGGEFTLAGALGLGPAGLRELALNLEFERVRFELSRDLWGVGTGGLSLRRNAEGKLELSGQARLHEAAFREHIALVPLTQGAFRRRPAALRTYDPTREIVSFDVGLRIPDRLRVDYNLDLVSFRAELAGNLQLVGTNERLGLLGELDSLEGRVSYLSKDFEVSSTRIQFVDPFSIRSRIEIHAGRQETVDRGDEGKMAYQVELGLLGEGDDFRVSLRSNPPLGEHDIITLLSLGVTSRDLETFRGQDLVGLGGEIMLRSFRLDERLGQLFPFPPDLIQPKYVRLRSRLSKKTASTTPRLEAGVKLKVLSDELDLDYSRSLYDGTDQSLELSYRLSRGVTTRLGWEDSEDANIGDLGLDLRFSWEW